MCVVIPNDEADLVPAGPSFHELVRLFSDDFDSSRKLDKADTLLQLMKSVCMHFTILLYGICSAIALMFCLFLFIVSFTGDSDSL